MYGRTPAYLKDRIIDEYLFGHLSYRELALKYGMPHKRIHVWVMKKQGKKPVKQQAEEPVDDSPLPTDIKELQKALREANLKNKLLNTMIDIAEEQLKIDIRKKSGTKQ
jgi:transposase